MDTYFKSTAWGITLVQLYKPFYKGAYFSVWSNQETFRQKLGFILHIIMTARILSYWNGNLCTRFCANSAGKNKSVLSRTCKPNITPNAAPVYSHPQVSEWAVTRRHAQLVIGCILWAAAACIFFRYLFKGGCKKKNDNS